MSDWPGYPDRLGELVIGAKFQMLNYESTYIRVATSEGYYLMHPDQQRGPVLLDDDGFHVPICDLRTGRLSWMSKEKPVRIVLL